MTVRSNTQLLQPNLHKKEENMANWGIASTALEIEKIKAEMADYLYGLRRLFNHKECKK